MTAYALSPRARADLDGIWDYTAGRWGVDQADGHVRQIIDACADLAHGRSVGQAIDHVRAGYIRHASGSHVLFHRWDGGRRMEVIRILHRRVEFGRHL